MTDDTIVQLAPQFAAATVAEVDVAKRTITGLIQPYGVIGEIRGGPAKGKYVFARGSVVLPEDISRVKLAINHSTSNVREVVGHLAATEEREDGLWGTFALDGSPEATQTLDKAHGKVWDGLSAGYWPHSRFELGSDGVRYAVAAHMQETSVTPFPVFVDARITGVAASAVADHQEGSTMPDKPTGAPVLDKPSTEVPDPPAGTEPVTFSEEQAAKFSSQLDELERQLAGLKDMKVPVPTAQFSVKEEPVYRFAGTEKAASGFDFAEDIYKAAIEGDAQALQRVHKFTKEAAEHGPKFAAHAQALETAARFGDSGDAGALSPTEYRPDLFLGQAPTPRSPLYDAFHKGALSSIRPFNYAILDRALSNAAVGNHTEGVDPAATNVVTTTSTDVQPAPMSGKVHITREVADLGGNPNYSALVWLALERSHAIQRETKTAALLAAVAATTTSLLPAPIAAGATGAVAGAAIERGLARLQFVPEVDLFDHAFGHQDLYVELAAATTTDGAKLYPIINPANRSGTARSRWRSIDIGGYDLEPAWALGAASAGPSNSWVASSMAVHVWSSGLQRLDRLQETVEGYDIGAWAYFAGVVWDPTLLRVAAYDPTA